MHCCCLSLPWPAPPHSEHSPPCSDCSPSQPSPCASPASALLPSPSSPLPIVAPSLRRLPPPSCHRLSVTRPRPRQRPRPRPRPRRFSCLRRVLTWRHGSCEKTAERANISRLQRRGSTRSRYARTQHSGRMSHQRARVSSFVRCAARCSWTSPLIILAAQTQALLRSIC